LAPSKATGGADPHWEGTGSRMIREPEDRSTRGNARAASREGDEHAQRAVWQTPGKLLRELPRMGMAAGGNCFMHRSSAA